MKHGKQKRTAGRRSARAMKPSPAKTLARCQKCGEEETRQVREFSCEPPPRCLVCRGPLEMVADPPPKMGQHMADRQREFQARMELLERLAGEKGLTLHKCGMRGHVLVIGGPVVVQYWPLGRRRKACFQYIARSVQEAMEPADVVAMALEGPEDGHESGGGMERMDRDNAAHMASMGREALCTPPGSTTSPHFGPQTTLSVF